MITDRKPLTLLPAARLLRTPHLGPFQEISMRIAYGLGPLLLLLTLTATSQTTPAAPPCTQPEYKQLDFWVGEWVLSWPGAKAGDPENKAANTIRKELGGCVIEENFDGSTTGGLIGKSVSMYSSATGKWHQTWVDNQGAYLELVGGWDGKEFHLWREGKNPKGQMVQQRMIFKNITADSFDWSWEVSNDSGKTWKMQWPIHYTRKKS
jgi:hypothetical protein